MVLDSAAYCKKVFTTVYPKSVYVLCLTHIVNLATEIFHHHKDFNHTSDLIMMITSSLFKKPGRKSRLLKYMNDFVSKDDIKLLPVPVSSR